MTRGSTDRIAEYPRGWYTIEHSSHLAMIQLFSDSLSE